MFWLWFRCASRCYCAYASIVCIYAPLCMRAPVYVCPCFACNSACVCWCAAVSCLNDQIYYTHGHMMVAGDNWSFPQWEPAIVKRPAVLSSGALAAVASGKNAISYLTPHHQTHISISLDRPVTKPTFCLWSHESANLDGERGQRVGVFLCCFSSQ